METQNSTNFLEVVKTIGIVIIAICSIILVKQGRSTQDVYVSGGDIDADVSGRVEVENVVDVNLQYINGHRDVFFNNPRIGHKDKYYVLPVSVE